MLEATTSAFPGYPRKLEITGVEGTLIVEGDTLTTGRSPPGGRHLTSRRPAAHASAASPVVADASAHQRVLEDFLQAVRADREPACSGREGRRSVAVVEAIYESARSGNTVNIA